MINFCTRRGMPLNLLDKDQCTQLHYAVLEILESTGVMLKEPQALELLRGAGARIKGDRVRIPAYLIEEALRTAPPRITIYNRDGERAMLLERDKYYFGAQSDLVQILDDTTGERRKMVAKDVAIITRLADALPNIDYTLCGSAADDYPPEVIPRVDFVQTVSNTTKPIAFISNDANDLADIARLAEIVLGGDGQLTEKPYIIHYAEPVSPLMHFDPAVRKMLCCAELRIPVVYSPMLQSGVTAPATFAGILAQALAESLSGLVIQQLKRPGAPFILGAIPMHFDMRTMILPYGAPEMHLLSSAMATMAHYYHLPVFGTAGCTDAKQIDAQAGTEAALSVYIAALSGANLIHDIGLMDHATILSADFLVYNDEIISMVKNYFRPVKIDAESLALDVIDSVGPGRNFLQEKHTLKHYKEDWYPDLFDRSIYEKWQDAGKRTLVQRLQKKTQQILEKHEPKPLLNETMRELDTFQRKWLPDGPRPRDEYQ
jgi:trimethylamine--corrinoid protein Co-methyltransferase